MRCATSASTTGTLDLPRGEPAAEGPPRRSAASSCSAGRWAPTTPTSTPSSRPRSRFIEKAIDGGTARARHLPRRAADRAGARRARLSRGAARGRLGAGRRSPTTAQDDPLFVGLGDPTFTVFHLHGDTYELPPDAVNLATLADRTSSRRSAGAEIVYGFQFHLEFTEPMISRLAERAAVEAVHHRRRRRSAASPGGDGRSGSPGWRTSHRRSSGATSSSAACRADCRPDWSPT